ncbi:MAG: NUDIX hydrolase, partial [Holophagales bacterium]|nr:NUDIX hydrolase [Holophagales bacterium]
SSPTTTSRYSIDLAMLLAEKFAHTPGVAVEALHPVERGDSSLALDPDLSRALATLLGYEPVDAEQKEIRRRMVAFVAANPGDDGRPPAHRRTCLRGHLTASALVLDAAGERTLLLLHRKLGKWLQPGGHCDGDANLPGVALREAEEESGIEGLGVVPAVFDLDIHEIPARPGEPAHLHLDTRFLVIAPEGAEPQKNHESRDLRWFFLQEALTTADDPSLSRMLRQILGKVG